MLQYLKLREYKRISYLNKYWNAEYRRSFPIPNKLFKERLLQDPNLDFECSYVALYQNSVVGFILVKTWKVDSPYYNMETEAAISLFYVIKDTRGMGIGSDLLNLTIENLRKNTKVKRLHLGNETICLFPGLPSKLSNSMMFFISKGFISSEGSCDMIQIVKKKDIKEVEERTKDDKLFIRVATEEDRDIILRFCLDNNMNKEAYLVNYYFSKGGSGRRIVLGFYGDELVGFYRIHEQKGIPVKVNVFKDARIGVMSYCGVTNKYNDCDEISTKLVIAAKQYLILRKCKKIIVSNTPKVNFYRKLDFRTNTIYHNYVLDIENYNGK